MSRETRQGMALTGGEMRRGKLTLLREPEPWEGVLNSIEQHMDAGASLAEAVKWTHEYLRAGVVKSAHDALNSTPCPHCSKYRSEPS